MNKNLSTPWNCFIATLSNPTRPGIIEAIKELPKHVIQIAAELNQEQSIISHNLRRARGMYLETKFEIEGKGEI